MIEPALARKVAELAPAAIVTEDGTLNTPVLLESATAAPEPEAALESVTVQVLVPPELSEVGAQEKDVIPEAARTVIDALWDAPLYTAEMVTVWPAALRPGITTNVAEVALAAMLTCEGTVTPELSLETDADAAVGALLESEIVQVAVLPAGTNAGVQFKAVIVTEPPLGGGLFDGGGLFEGGGVEDDSVKEMDADWEVPL